MYGYDRGATRYLPVKGPRPAVRLVPVELPGGQAARVPADRGQRDASTSWTRTRLFYALNVRLGPHRVEAQDRHAQRVVARLLERPALRGQPGAAAGGGARTPRRKARCCGGTPLPGRSESSPLVHNGKVIFGCESGDIFALDAKTGKVRLEGPHRRRGEGRPGLRQGDPLRRQLRRRGLGARRRQRAREVDGAHAGRWLPARRRRLLDPGGRIRARLPGRARRPRLQLRREDRRTRLEPLDRAPRSTRLPPWRTRRMRRRPSSSAQRTSTSTRSTPRPVRCAGSTTSTGSFSARPASSTDRLRLGDRPEHRHLRLRRQRGARRSSTTTRASTTRSSRTARGST